MSLSFLLNEINQVELKSKSSVQIYDDFVKPKSLASGWSYVEYLESKEETKQYVKEANLFVSHRWQDCFYDILEAISRWIRMNGENIEDVVIWIDIFCQSHTYMTATPVDFDYWNQLFRSIIKKIGRVVVVPFPWNKPDHFHRVWCIWDIYSALKLDNTFHLVLSEREEKSFTNDIKKFGIDSIKKMIAAIDVQNSTGAVQIDVERIHDEIRKEIGFDTLNKLFLRKMQQAFIDIITRIIQQETSSREKGFLLSALSALYLFQGNLIEAEQYCKESIRTLSNDSDLLYERILLGEICISQEKYEEALQIFQNCHDKISKLSNYSVSPRLEDLAELRNPYHLFVQCQRGLVEVLINLGRYENAEIELQSTFDRLQVKADNNYNPLLIGLSNLLIESYEKQGKFELAESLYHHSYRTLSEFHGERHPDTMAALYKLATVYIYRDQLESEKIFRKCLVAQLSILPKDHPETLKTATGLAILLTKMSRFDEAEELFRNVIDSTRSFNHFEALFSYGRCLMEEGKLDEAGPVLTETFDSRKRDLGVDHPNTLIAMKQIVEFHQRRNCQKEASEWYQDYIVLRRASLDRYLPENDHILGIKLSYLERFLTKNYDRRFVATRDIKNIILEETMEYKCSYCEMIRKRNSGDSSVGKATVFVSHYWGNKITQLVTILRHHFSSFETEAERDPYLWIDLFSFNQHITTNFNFFGSIEAIIANINNTVMVFEAWNSPLPLTRAWCIWELYCTIDTNSKFTIAFGGEGEVGVEGGGLDEVLDSIKCEESQCEFERDRVRIYETILRSITFPKLNRLIKEVISSKIK